jgi:hypothetical protein
MWQYSHVLYNMYNIRVIYNEYTTLYIWLCRKTQQRNKLVHQQMARDMKFITSMFHITTIKQLNY